MRVYANPAAADVRGPPQDMSIYLMSFPRGSMTMVMGRYGLLCCTTRVVLHHAGGNVGGHSRMTNKRVLYPQKEGVRRG